jgi:hypothetical protein
MSLRVAAGVRQLDSFMDEEAPSPAEITRILHEWQAGSREAFDRRLSTASRQLAREWRQNRLDTTGVVNEAYVSLFRAEVSPLVASGRVKALKTVVEGLDQAPAAFLSLLKGGNVGKMIVHIT